MLMDEEPRKMIGTGYITYYVQTLLTNIFCVSIVGIRAVNVDSI